MLLAVYSADISQFSADILSTPLTLLSTPLTFLKVCHLRAGLGARATVDKCAAMHSPFIHALSMHSSCIHALSAGSRLVREPVS